MLAVKKNTRKIRRITSRLAYLLLHIKKRDVQVFLFCLVGASFLWIFNALNKERSERISYPIEFSYDREHYVEVKDLPKSILLEVKGTGWQILRKILRIRIQAIKYTINQPSNPLRNVLIVSQLRKRIVEVLKDVRLEEIITDTIPILIDKKYSRIIELKIDSTHIPLTNGFRVDGKINIFPKRVAFTGPEKMIRALPSPFIISLNNIRIESDFKQNIPIRIPSDTNQLIQKDEEFATINFQVAPYTTQKHTFIVQLRNFPPYSKLYLKGEHRQIELTYAFKRKDTGNIRLQDFKVVADFNTFNPRDSSVAIQLLSKPKFIQTEDIRHKRRIKLDYAP